MDLPDFPDSTDALHLKFTAVRADQHDSYRRESSWKSLTIKAFKRSGNKLGSVDLHPETFLRSHLSAKYDFSCFNHCQGRCARPT